MTRNILIVAALLLVNLAGIANAADLQDPTERRSKGARKVIATLNSIGINSKELNNFISQADSHVEKGNLYLMERKMDNGRLALRYNLGSTRSLPGLGNNNRLHLNYTPKDSHWQVTAQTKGIMFNYHYDLH